MPPAFSCPATRQHHVCRVVADEHSVLTNRHRRFFTRAFLFVVTLLTLQNAALAAGTATTTTLSASSSTLAHGSVLTLTATVVAGSTAVFPGSVRFCDITTVTSCHDSQLINQAQLVGTGIATYKFVPSIGSHTYKAIFVGTSNYLTSTSANLSATVTGQFPTKTVLTSSGSAGAYTLNASVSNFGSVSSSPTGTVSFNDATNANYALGSAALGSAIASQSSTVSSSNSASVPRYIAVGDFNGDGIPDFAVALQNNSQVAVYLGHGDGTYVQASGSPYSVGSTAVGIATADFNNDGKLDLVVTSYGSNSVSILLGRGDGTFQPSVSFGSVAQAVYIVAADFNNDGNMDIAVCSQSGNSVSIFLGNGDGTFTAGAILSVGSQPYGIVVADFNNDGKADLVVSNKNGTTLNVLLGAGDGTFTQPAGSPITVGARPLSVVVADFNNDGYPDIAVGNSGDSTISLLMGHGDGTFATPTSLTASGTADKYLVATDLNRTGKTDLISAENNGNLSVYAGNGDGTFQSPVTTATGAGVLSNLASLDADGDGFPDLLIASNSNASIYNSLHRYVRTATATVSSLSVPGAGTHNVGATYQTDNTSAGSTSSSIPLTASPTATSISITAAPGSSTYSQQVALTATLSPYLVGAESNNGESITFKNGSTSLGTAVLSNGVATLQTTALPLGTDSLTAIYAADTNFLGSTSAAVAYVVGKNTPVLSWPTPSPITYGTALSNTQLNATTTPAGTFVYTPNSGTVLNAGTQTLSVAFAPNDTTDYNTASGSTTLTVTQAAGMVLLSAATNPIPYGTSETFTATVSTSGTGVITFKDGATTLGTGTLSGGTASFSTSALATGSHSITAVWPGDTNYIASTSSALALTVQKAAINIAGSATLNPSIFGDSITLTWACTGAVATPSGSLTLKDGATTLTTLPLDASGIAHYTLSTLTAATHTLTVTYSGDTNYN